MRPLHLTPIENKFSTHIHGPERISSGDIWSVSDSSGANISSELFLIQSNISTSIWWAPTFGIRHLCLPDSILLMMHHDDIDHQVTSCQSSCMHTYIICLSLICHDFHSSIVWFHNCKNEPGDGKSLIWFCLAPNEKKNKSNSWDIFSVCLELMLLYLYTLLFVHV